MTTTALMLDSNDIVWHYSWGDMNECLVIVDRELTTDKSNDGTKVQLDEPMIFMGVTYRNVGEVLVNRSRNDSKAAELSKLIPAWVTIHKS